MPIVDMFPKISKWLTQFSWSVVSALSLIVDSLLLRVPGLCLQFTIMLLVNNFSSWDYS